MKIVSGSINNTLSIGKAIARNSRPGDIICLFGELGTGKTVLTKGIALGLGIDKKKVISPSFVLIRQHNQGRHPLYHFDLYRLRTAQEILGLGYEEYLYGEGLSVIEWADRLGELMPEEFLRVDMELLAGAKRLLKFAAFGRRYKQLLKDMDEDISH